VETKRIISLLALIMVVSGCALLTQSSAPIMPEFSTEQGKSCARSCQTIYSQCNQSCGAMVGGTRTASQREKCFNNCNQVLSDCYLTCE